MDAARVLGGDPLAGFNSVERRLEVAKLVVRVVRKARTTPRDVASKGSWEASTFGDEVSRINPKPELTLDGFCDPSDGQERGVSASPKDSEHRSRVYSGVLREARGTLEAIPRCMGENVAKTRNRGVKVVG